MIFGPATVLGSFYQEFGEEKPKLVYPSDHQVGMRVPPGGSNCHKCEYVRNADQDCAQPDFQKWHGSEKLPLPADIYCCDFFAIGEASK
jgi:hypothetical protein